MVGTTWGTGQVLFDIFWFFLLLVEIWLIFTIFVDIFRRHDMKGWLKAFWVLVIIIVPLVGILLYLIIYGNEMKVHAVQQADEQARMFQRYAQDVAGRHSAADELERLAELKAKGVINDDEFERLKQKVVNG